MYVIGTNVSFCNMIYEAGVNKLFKEWIVKLVANIKNVYRIQVSR